LLLYSVLSSLLHGQAAIFSKPKGIIASMSIVIAVMFIVTGLKLAVRLSQGRRVVDWDDVFIVPGVVSLSRIHLSSIYECLPLAFL
jgi:hypothetical protein